MKRCTLALIAALAVVSSSSASAEEFRYNPPGQLVPGSGTGLADTTVYVPGMRFPVERAPAYANSQVWGHGGLEGPGGAQCDPANYSYPWWDNYCETRHWEMPLCPGGTGHQGQDLRAETCDPDLHWAVAAEAGQITSIGSYSVILTSDAGTIHRYLHMEPSSIPVAVGDRVERGQRLGRISDAFGGEATTVHLHYDLQQYVASLDQTVFVSPYMSLVHAYEELLGQPVEPCETIPASGGVVDDFGSCFTAYGNPTYWREADGGHGGRMHWTNAWVSPTPGNWARWNLHLAEGGTYEVEVNVVAPYNRSQKVPYMVRHDGQEDSVEVDQSAVSGWLSLGRFDFAAGGDQQVELYDNTGEADDDVHISADAVRLTRVEGGDPDAGGDGWDGNGDPWPYPFPRPGPDAGPHSLGGRLSVTTSSCACAAGGVAGGSGADATLLLLGLAGLYVHRSRRR